MRERIRVGGVELGWIEGWGELPKDVGDIPGVGCDSEGRVLLFCRGPRPLLALDAEGRASELWPELRFARPHGLATGPDGSVVLVDDLGHAVRRVARDGSLLLELAPGDRSDETGYRPGEPRSVRAAAAPFCFPTDAAFTPDGELVVTDGYGNARLHWFAPDGRLLRSVGAPGGGPGEFVLPHDVFADRDGTLYVCDRENDRVQLLDTAGGYLGEWPARAPNGLVRVGDLFVVAELGRVLAGAARTLVADAPRPRVTLRDSAGRVLAELAYPADDRTGLYFTPHGIAADAAGNVYVSEVPQTYSAGGAPPRPVLHKLVRLA